MNQLFFHEFMFIISPTEFIAEYIVHLKNCVRKVIGHFESESSKAHISLLNFKELHNDNILYLLEPHITQLAPFKLLVKDFAIFKNGDRFTIYLDIPYRWGISEITERLIGKSIKPHITIAKNLTLDECNKVHQMLKSESFSNQFACQYITVLKRIPGRKWNNYTNLWFKSR